VAKHDVFLASFEKAARYAMKFDAPTVLQIRISKPSRLKDLRTDPADDPRLQTSPGGMVHREDPLDVLRRELQQWGDKRDWPFDFQDSYRGSDVLPSCEDRPDEDYESAIGQMNLYRRMKDTLYETYNSNRADNEYDLFLDAFRPDRYGEVHIRNNGALRLDSSYWDRKHQIKYPDRLPPAAVKEVWVGEGVWQDRGLHPQRTREIRVDRLPGEADDIWSTVLEYAEELPDALRDGYDEAYEWIEDGYRILDDDPGALNEYREVMGQYEDIIQDSGSPQEAANKIEREVDYLPRHVGNEVGFAEYDNEFGLVRPGDV
jgi:hypothetical protein